MVTRRWIFLYIVLAVGLFLIVVAWSLRMHLGSSPPLPAIVAMTLA